MARHNPRLAKIHRTYTVEETAELYGVHKNTVRQWIKQGLPVLDNKRPLLIQGAELRNFIEYLRKRNKKSCKPGQIYCVRCRKPRKPDNDFAEYRPLTGILGDLVGLCPVCGTLIFRRVSLRKFCQAKGEIQVSFPKGMEHIKEMLDSSENCDFKTQGKN